MAKLLSINIAQPAFVQINEQPVLTAIYKQPVQGALWLGSLGLNGDGQADKTVHGGAHQAVYSYPIEHYAHWQCFLSSDTLPPGTFGENLTTLGLDEDSMYIGDILKIGEVLVQVTMPRIPCFKFAHKVNSKEIIESFLKSGRSGFYQRVLQEGFIEAGQEIEIVERDSRAVSVRTALIMQKLDLSLLGDAPANQLENALHIPSLAPLLKTTYEKRLADLNL